MRIEYGTKVMVSGSPEKCVAWLKDKFEQNAGSFPREAVVREADWNMSIPTLASKIDIDNIIKDMLKSQFFYVIAGAYSQPKGTYIHLKYRTYLTSLPNGTGKSTPIFRETTTTVRIGVKYNKTKFAAAALPTTTTSKPFVNSAGSLPWGTWNKKYPFMIEHKGKDYLRCTLTGSKAHKKTERYLLGNQEIELDSLNPATVQKIKKVNKGKPTNVFTLNVDNILELGKGGE